MKYIYIKKYIYLVWVKVYFISSEKTFSFCLFLVNYNNPDIQFYDIYRSYFTYPFVISNIHSTTKFHLYKI